MAQWFSSLVKISLHIICNIPDSIFVIVQSEIVLFSLVDILLSSEWLSGSPVLRVISQKAALKKHSAACFAHFCKDNEKTITKAETMKRHLRKDDYKGKDNENTYLQRQLQWQGVIAFKENMPVEVYLYSWQLCKYRS